MPTLRFTKGGAYTSDLTSICTTIRTNGTNVNVAAITVTHPLMATNVELLINLAYQPNGQLPLATASLYVLGFRNPHATYVFDLAPFPGGPLARAVSLVGIDGSYGSLGYAHSFGGLQITDATLQNSLQVLQNFQGGVYPTDLRSSLARLIIASSEALRLHTVGIGVNGVLGNMGVYSPDWNAVHSWGGHILGF